MLSELLRGVRANDRRLLAQAITLVESTTKSDQAMASELLQELHKTPATNDPIRIGICGPPGAGKSSLIEALGNIALKDDPENQIAVLAYDPSSIIAGGSLLGDKPRMIQLASNPRCYIRPSPSGTDGSITRSYLDICAVLQAAGYDAIMVETVGSGQADVDVRDLVDVLLYAVTANTGDWLQAMKRGITEVADILVVTKADIDPVATKQALQELANHHAQVRSISAHKNQGIGELWKAITSKFYSLSTTGELQKQREKQFRNWTQKVALLQINTLFKEYVASKHINGTLADSRTVSNKLVREFIAEANGMQMIYKSADYSFSFYTNNNKAKLEGKDESIQEEQQGEMLAMQEDIPMQHPQNQEKVPQFQQEEEQRDTTATKQIPKELPAVDQIVTQEDTQTHDAPEDDPEQHIEVTIGDEEVKDNFHATDNNNTSAQVASSGEKDPALVKEQLKYCSSVVLRGLKRHKDAGPFQLPVDPIALGIPDYPKVIKNPMDLSTINKKMEQQEYKTAEMFFADVRLMLTNCFTFNAPESQVYKMGKNMERYFENSILRMPQDLLQLKTESPVARRSSNPVTPVARPRRDTVSSPGVRRSSSMSTSSYVPSTPGRKAASGELTFCRAVLNELCKKTHQAFSWPFMQPVDPVVLGIPDYFDVIKQPMDIGSIRRKLDHREYVTAEQFETDVRLVFSNCYTYNAPDSEIVQMAKQLEQVFENKWATRSQFAAQQQHHQHAHHSVSSSIIGSSENEDEKILSISRQIQILQNELNDLLMRKKTGGSGASKPKSRPTPVGAVAGQPTAPAAPAKPPRPTFEELCKTELSFEEKRDLSEAVNNMPTDKLVRVVEIIHESMPSLKDNADSELIELDIESLDIRTLRRLQQYIRDCKLGPKKRKNSSTAGAGTKKKASNAAQAAAGMGPDSNAMPFPAESDSDDDEDDDDI